MARVSAFAPAKVNLTLQVGRPRADGRHPLASLVTFADVGDEVILEEGAGFTVEGPFAADAPAGEDNLVRRALALLGVSARATLVKNLPVAAGLGGGSADGAAALRAANLFAGIGLDEAALAERARALGADAPACVLSAPLWMAGGGETVARYALPDLNAVLINPGVSCGTAAVFAKFDEMGLGAAVDATPPAAPRDAEAALLLIEAGANDLTAPALQICFEMGDVLTRLLAEPRAVVARVTGSGATCFGLLAGAGEAEALAAAIAAEEPGWWVRQARLGAIDAAARRL
ncbi:MAG: 4-(cytidine 5'-diphospho)-2-C-methyl-D-erythritol kinase [Hyphomonadaceae bacterium]